MILGVESSLPLMSVALVEGKRTLAAAVVRGEASRNEKLLPAIDWLLREAGVGIDAVELFAVTRGPGSFTGLRIGLATVQGIARAAGRPVCAVSTLQAASFDGDGSPLVVLADAGRGELYAGVFEKGRETLAPHVVDAAGADALAQQHGRVLDLRYEGDDINVALRAAKLAAMIRADGELDRYDDAVPLYVRLAEPEAKLISS